MTKQHNKQRAFTLAEMAIVVVLTGILLTLGLKITASSLANSAYTTTTANQAQIKAALINFLRTNRRLPCPDTAAVPSGTEAATCNASAAASYGVVPWTTLLLPRDAAQDGWGNFFTYKVANGVAPVVKNWTVNTAVATTFDINQLPHPSIGITINQGDGVGAPTLLTQNAVVVILSAGKNGYGAKTLQGQSNAAPPVINKDEIINATNTATTFILRPYTENPLALNGPFDDKILYLLPQDLLQPLVAEQTIASCKSYCSPCTGNKAPWIFCTAANTPLTVNASSCTGVNTPYVGCTGVATPALCTVPATAPAPVGNPTPSCQ